jgi:hypothetical protein
MLLSGCRRYRRILLGTLQIREAADESMMHCQHKLLGRRSLCRHRARVVSIKHVSLTSHSIALYCMMMACEGVLDACIQP